RGRPRRQGGTGAPDPPRSTVNLTRRLGRRFARLATNALVRWPSLWRVFRGPLRAQFERLAPVWDTMRTPQSFVPYETALAALEAPPRRALDLGTGTGTGARLIAQHFPETEVVGGDLAQAMIEEAQRN